MTRSRREPAGAPASSSDPILTQGEKREIINRLALHIAAATPLAALAESDTFTTADRVLLRQTCDHGAGIFNLSNFLNRLCSEASRATARRDNQEPYDPAFIAEPMFIPLPRRRSNKGYA